MEEKWIDGYEGHYSVTSDGRVFSFKRRKRLLRQRISHGYNTAALLLNQKTKYAKIHRLVAEAFIPNPENKPMVNHKDGNKLNNHVSNLEWVTAKENVRHALASGLMKPLKGEAHPKSKLNNIAIKEIKSLISNENLTQKEIGTVFRVGNSVISAIINGRTRWTEKTEYKHKHADVMGEKNVKAKLSEKDIVEIKSLLSQGLFQKNIAKIFNVTQSTISSINVGKTWPHTAQL